MRRRHSRTAYSIWAANEKENGTAIAATNVVVAAERAHQRQEKK